MGVIIEPKSTLVLPASFFDQPARRSIVTRYCTFENVCGRPSSVGELTQLLGTLRRSDVVGWISCLLEVTNQKDGVSSSTQCELARELLESELADKVIGLQNEPSPCVIFHRRQLWVLLQLALIVCREDTPPPEERQMRNSLGQACLMTSDLLRQIENVLLKAPEESAESRDFLMTVMTAISDISVNNDVLARAQSFWFDSLANPKVKREFERLAIGSDLNDIFTSAYGLSLKEFFFIAVNLYFTFLASAVHQPVSAALVDASVWSGGLFSEEDKKKVLVLLSLKADEMAAFLFGNPRQSWATDFSPLLSHPLIEVFPDRYACPDLSYFRLFFVDGVYWLLDAAIKNGDWRKFFGEIFAWYVNQIIDSFTVSSTLLVRTFFQPTKFRGTESEVCDGLILWEKTAVLCEYKSSRLTTRARSAGQMKETIKAIEQALGSKERGVGQLAKSLERILGGQTVVSGDAVVDIASREMILPALVWYDESAANHVVRDHLQELFSAMLREKCIDAARIGPLLLFTTHDLELFEQFARIESAETLMREYAVFVGKHPHDPLCAFRAYAHAKFDGKQRPKGFIAAKLDSVLEEIYIEHSRREQLEPKPGI